MEKVVADASVIVKWFVDEIYSDNTRNLRNAFINGSIEIILIARALALYGFRLFPLSKNLAEKTAEIAMEKNITVYDAAYVALAEEQKARLFTADEKLIKKVNLDSVKHIGEL